MRPHERSYLRIRLEHGVERLVAHDSNISSWWPVDRWISEDREHSFFTVCSWFLSDESDLRILKSYFSKISDSGRVEIGSWNEDEAISLEDIEEIGKDPSLSSTGGEFNNTALFSSSEAFSYGSIGLSLEFSLIGIHGECVERLEEMIHGTDHHRRTIASGSNLEWFVCYFSWFLWYSLRRDVWNGVKSHRVWPIDGNICL